MIDLKEKIEVFIITNGRSTFPHCKKSIDEQIGCSFKVSVIENEDWLRAHFKILEICKSSFFLRVDDDMFLSPYAMSFFGKCIGDISDSVALRGCRLWEPWSNKICKGIKIYRSSIARKIGFRIDGLGKIDKPFTEDCEKQKYKIKYSRDVVAIHACGNIEEHIRYWTMRGENIKDKVNSKIEWAKGLISDCKLSLEQQFELSKGFIEDLNRKNNTDFGGFVDAVKKNSI